MDYSEIRGFNYQPGYASIGFKIWSEFNEKQIQSEISRGKKYFPKTNALRLWLSFDAYVDNTDLFVRNFEKLLEITDKNGIKAMPVLFNNWHSIPDFGGIAAEQVRYWNVDSRCHAYMSYIDDIVGRHVNDNRVLIWDLCNEPFNSGIEETFIPWLKRLYYRCKELGAKAPITIGVQPDMRAIELVEPICDVLSPHLYLALGYVYKDVEPFRQDLDMFVEFAKKKDKPILAGETGWGHLDDDQRVQILKNELEELTIRKIGYFIHMLNHSLVADGHRPEYGFVSEVGFMGCIEADGSLRKGHEIINEY